ncbi:hypothetical protein A4A32_01830 [Staphylococcus equorum]|uniref:DUF1381 domain-containing protein n=1 Tax=Staphylococcus equorum TaxID=246432 RepID=UPI0008FAF45E|nr:DUF1381 domain-containing protein [Staphylococcus equorum]OIS56073.1 hypothetical protein A4A32_01830 [Staphylococcus equorum]
MQFLIRHITDSTGHTFTEVIKPRENERYEIVSAESKKEAEEKYKNKKVCPNCESWNTEYEHVYGENTPLYIHFMCHECEHRCVNHARKDSEQ